MKIILLVTLILLLTSCLDSKVNENNKISENINISGIETNNFIKKEIGKIKDEQATLDNKKLDLTDKIIPAQQNEKDLGNGFKLKQNIDDTLLTYKGTKVYTWPHTSKKNPFKWDDACEMLFKKFNENGKASQLIWESLTEEEQKSCLKETLYKEIFLKPTNNPNFFTFGKYSYDRKKTFIINITNNQVIIPNGDSIEKIKNGENGTYIFYTGLRGCTGGLTLITDKNIELFKNNCDVNLNNIPSNYKMLLDFKLLTNKKIQLKYKGGTEMKEMVTTINLDDYID